MLDTSKRVVIVGLGLLGGRYALGLTRAGFAVDGIDRSPEAVEFALKEGYIQRGAAENFAPLLAEAGYVVLGLYPTALLDWLKQYGGLLPAGCLVTDTCGVKTGVVDTAQALMPEGVEFIGSHPMAGKEVSGVTNAHLVDFAPANFIITPTEKNTQPAIDAVHELAEILGFGRISILTPREHDEMIGFLSQLTHVIAISLMNCQDNTHLAAYTGDSFRDLTRIARINDKLWSELFLLNRDILEQEIDSIVSELNAVKGLLQDGDREGLREKMRQSTLRRAAFDRDKQGGAAK